jgi:hypothetical protein
MHTHTHTRRRPSVQSIGQEARVAKGPALPVCFGLARLLELMAPVKVARPCLVRDQTRPEPSRCERVRTSEHGERYRKRSGIGDVYLQKHWPLVLGAARPCARARGTPTGTARATLQRSKRVSSKRRRRKKKSRRRRWELAPWLSAVSFLHSWLTPADDATSAPGPTGQVSGGGGHSHVGRDGRTHPWG